MAVYSVVDSCPLVEQIRAYEEALHQYRFRPDFSHCPLCQAPVDGLAFFRRHEKRPRTFRVIVDALVHTLHSWISRWKGPCCGKTFTLYPSFAIPHKRYVAPQILERSQRYVEDEELSYRGGVRDEGRPISHVEPAVQEPTSDSAKPPRAEAEGLVAVDHVLAHTTPYRWLSTLGQMPKTLRVAWERLKQKEPDAALFREVAGFRVAPKKYRTAARRRVLHDARAVGLTERFHQQVFGTTIIPRFATRPPW